MKRHSIEEELDDDYNIQENPNDIDKINSKFGSSSSVDSVNSNYIGPISFVNDLELIKELKFTNMPIIVLFFAEWCGHCQKYLPVYHKFAEFIDALTWPLKTFALHCPENNCKMWNVHFFPTIKLYHPSAQFSSVETLKNLSTTDDQRRSLIDISFNYINDLMNLPYHPNSFHHPTPNCTFINPCIFINKNVDFKFSAYLFESCLSAQFSIFENRTELIYVSKEDTTLIIDDNKNDTEIYELIMNNQKFIQKYCKRLKSYISYYKTDQVDLWKKFRNHKKSTEVEFEIHNFKTALYVSLNNNVFQNEQSIKASTDWLQLLNNCFKWNSTEKESLSKLHDYLSNTKSLNDHQFYQLLEDEFAENKYFIGDVSYPHYLWLFFHSATINCHESKDERFYGMSIMKIIQNFVKNLFSCSVCRGHFMNMTINASEIIVDGKSLILGLWNYHNKVNKRLEKTIEYNPFPSESTCPQCRIQTNLTDNSIIWNENEVLKFLNGYYDVDFHQITIKRTIIK